MNNLTDTFETEVNETTLMLMPDGRFKSVTVRAKRYPEISGQIQSMPERAHGAKDKHAEQQQPAPTIQTF